VKQLSHLTIIWDEQPGGNAEHIADNFQTYEDVENVLSYPFEKTVSRRTGLPLWKGSNLAGDEVAVVFRWIEDATVYPVTAFRIKKDI